MMSIIQSEEERASDPTVDSTFISLIVRISHTVRTVYLVSLILVVSYFLGLLWYVFCQFSKNETDNFIAYYGIKQDVSNHFELTILLTYFSFTTLSTVGFGDFHPVSDSERVVAAFLLLFGVAITSYIMENLNGMISALHNLQADFEENDKLSLFMGTLERFNGGQKMSKELERSILSYFEYRWQLNKNIAISTEAD